MTPAEPDPPAPVLPVSTEAGLCRGVLRALQGSDPAPDEMFCKRLDPISGHATLFEARADGDSSYFLAQQLSGGWRLVATLGTVYGGRSNMSGWLGAIRASRGDAAHAREVVFDYRFHQTDWDIGYKSYSEQTSCQRLRCVETEDGRLSCERATILVERGGYYTVEADGPGPSNWPYKVGAPTEQWDCQAPSAAEP